MIVVLALWITIPLLALTTFVQVLYLESLRLRTRDLPSLKYFKESIEPKLGLKAEDGAGAFSLVKHTLLILVAILFFAWFADGEPWHDAIFWQAAFATVLTMLAVSFALPQLLYRRTSAGWLLPLVPLLRLFALVARPAVAALGFFQSLIETHRRYRDGRGRTDSRREHRGADLCRHGRRIDPGRGSQVDSIRGGVRR